MSKYEELRAAVKAADQALREYILACYPPKSRVTVMLRYGQIHPTPATVYGYGGDGMVRIEIDTAKPNSRQRFRTVMPNDIVSKD